MNIAHVVRLAACAPLAALQLLGAVTAGSGLPPAPAASPAGLAAADWQGIRQAYLKASNTDAEDNFGQSVAVSGDTVVVGAPQESSSTTQVNSTPNNNALRAGAAYVFVRTSTGWVQQAYLKAGNAGALDSFGQSVAISGNTIVVGAQWEDGGGRGVNGPYNDNNPGSGAAYIFVREGSTWKQQAYLKAAQPSTGDDFGWAVAVSGDTVLVGARGEGVVDYPPFEGLPGPGAAYVYVRSGAQWILQARLVASNRQMQDAFGFAVALSGDTAVIGAPLEDSGTKGINGAPNEAAPDAGAAYVFVRYGTTWFQKAFLKAHNTEAYENFGLSVAVSGDTVVVGAPAENSSTTGVNSISNNNATNAGAAYVYVRTGNTWTEQAYLKAGNTGAYDSFGRSVAVSGNTAVVGAWDEDSSQDGTPDENADSAGAAYVFVRQGTTWAQQAYLKASNVGAKDFFGGSVAIADGTVVVGATVEDSSTTGVNSTPDEGAERAGAAYIFQLPAEIVVEQPAGTDLPDGGSRSFTAVSGNAAEQVFTVRNTGPYGLNLTGTPRVTVSGPDAPLFTVTAQPESPVVAGGATTFTVRFAPTSGGNATAALTVANEDADEGGFTIHLTGTGLSFTTDTDGDGLNDAAELQLAALGFDWQTAQPALVSTLRTHANGAGLYTPAQVQALHVGVPLLARDGDGRFKLTLGLEKSIDLSSFSPLPFVPGQTAVNGDGKIEFQFTVPDNAAFFRLEAE